MSDRCYTIDDLGFPITLDQDGPDSFTVTYGRQVRDHLTYSQACHELGAAILHALACDSRIDNRTREEAEAEP